jgi:ketol-acid reductoisomerase
LTEWIRTCFELGVEFGFSPELMVMELYASGETAEIMGAMARNGFFRQMAHHSTTSQYGTLSRGPELVTDAMRAKARELFLRDVRGAAFVREWTEEQALGSAKLESLRKQALDHPMSKTELKVIAAVQAAHALDASG